MIASASPPGQANRTDRDQGDDRASDRAIQVVCTQGHARGSALGHLPAPDIAVTRLRCLPV
jgi:hypothetical protein